MMYYKDIETDKKRMKEYVDGLKKTASDRRSKNKEKKNTAKKD